jgi:hypothetical protein
LQQVSKETGEAEEDESRVEGRKKSLEVHKIKSFEALGEDP